MSFNSDDSVIKNSGSNTMGFDTSSGVGGGDADYNATSTDLDQQPAGQFGQFGGGIGDRTQGQGKFGSADVNQPSSGDQYGSSGGYDGKAPGQGQAAAVGGEGGRGREGRGDALDKGVDLLERKAEHE